MAQLRTLSVGLFIGAPFLRYSFEHEQLILQLNLQVIKSCKHKEKNIKCCNNSHIQQTSIQHFEENSSVFFSWLNFLIFQFPRTEVSLIGLKSNFAHHDNCTNVWWQMLEEKREELGVDKGLKDTMVVVVE